MAIMRKKILLILALLCLTVTGAWTDEDICSRKWLQPQLAYVTKYS
jgi:hypothetical protein